MAGLFTTLFYEPIFNGLMALVRWLPGHDLGVAIVGMTLIIRGLLVWPSLSQIRSSRSLQVLQPKLKALQQQLKDNRQEYAKRVMELYREHKVNPLSSCLPTLIQLPFLFALYQVFMSGIQIDPATQLLKESQLTNLYGSLREFYAATPVETISLGFLNLAKNHNIILAVIVGLTQFVQAKMLVPKTNPPQVKGAQDEQMATTMMRQTTYIFPALFAWISYTVPSGLGLYFLISNFFSIAQQWLVMKDNRPKETSTT